MTILTQGQRVSPRSAAGNSMHCAECGAEGANARQLCPACEPLYTDNDPEPFQLVGDECDCIVCRSDLAGLVPCVREAMDA